MEEGPFKLKQGNAAPIKFPQENRTTIKLSDVFNHLDEKNNIIKLAFKDVDNDRHQGDTYYKAFPIKKEPLPGLYEHDMQGGISYRISNYFTNISGLPHYRGKSHLLIQEEVIDKSDPLPHYYSLKHLSRMGQAANAELDVFLQDEEQIFLGTIKKKIPIIAKIVPERRWKGEGGVFYRLIQDIADFSAISNFLGDDHIAIGNPYPDTRPISMRTELSPDFEIVGRSLVRVACFDIDENDVPIGNTYEKNFPLLRERIRGIYKHDMDAYVSYPLEDLYANISGLPHYKGKARVLIQKGVPNMGCPRSHQYEVARIVSKDYEESVCSISLKVFLEEEKECHIIQVIRKSFPIVYDAIPGMYYHESGQIGKNENQEEFEFGFSYGMCQPFADLSGIRHLVHGGKTGEFIIDKNALMKIGEPILDYKAYFPHRYEHAEWKNDDTKLAAYSMEIVFFEDAGKRIIIDGVPKIHLGEEIRPYAEEEEKAVNDFIGEPRREGDFLVYKYHTKRLFRRPDGTIFTWYGPEMTEKTPYVQSDDRAYQLAVYRSNQQFKQNVRHNVRRRK
jgi:hypothetical protein